MGNIKLSLSVVSHGHKEHIGRLVEDLVRLGRPDIELILTLNMPEDLPVDVTTLPFGVKVINNTKPKGFAANHNSAFTVSEGANFVILNPDIKLINDPFDVLLVLIEANPGSICAPMVVNNLGAVEDSARNFPSPGFLLKRHFGRLLKKVAVTEIVRADKNLIKPDWVAGMFVVIPRAVYRALNGLSERYHLYFEDVDFCARAHLAGHPILVSKNVKVIHEAQRDSHRKLKYLLWHLHSAMKFFTSKAYLRIRLNRLLGSEYSGR